MAKLWTSPRTGRTYDMTSVDGNGNWVVTSAPFFGSLTALAGQAALMGGLFLIIGLFIAFGASVMFVGFTMAVARWFVTPIFLTLVCLGLLALPEGRRRWYVLVGTALFCLIILLPGTFASMYFLGHGYYAVGSGYAWAASIPLVPVMFLIMSVWLAIRRSWWVMLLSLFMTFMTGLMSLMAWAQYLTTSNAIVEPEPPAVSSLAMDNILSVLTYAVVLMILTVIAQQISASLERRNLDSQMPDPAHQV